MALINCTECGSSVSDKATSCPHCGAPIENNSINTKFCKHCGEIIDKECVVCPKCGKQVEEIKTHNDNNIIINNTATANSTVMNPTGYGREKNKWISLLLCIFTVCGHKFYEGKFLMGIVYLFTGGLFGIGWIIDIISLLGKPNPYYV